MLQRPVEPAQYVAIWYTERLREAEAVASVGTVGDSYDNAMAESFNSLYKAELIHNQGPWPGLDQVEFATMEYIEWYNTRQLHGELGYRTPVEAEQDYYNHHTAATAACWQVREPLQNPGRFNVNFYESMWRVMSDRELALPARLTAIRGEATEIAGDERIERLSDLRVFDIVVWMAAKHP